MERSASLCERLVGALGREAVRTDAADLIAYRGDAAGEGELPTVLVLPADVAGVVATIAIAREFETPIVARGAGTGLSGAASLARGGIALSLARMNRVLDLDAPNRSVRVEAGATARTLEAALQQHELIFAPTMASDGVATLAGRLATNSVGSRAIAYGRFGEHVLALELVLDDGTTLELRREAAGYDLPAALAGSEGTLGIITALELRLQRRARTSASLLVAFATNADALQAIAQTLRTGEPIAAEVVDSTVLRAIDTRARLGWPPETGALALIELAGDAEDVRACEAGLVRLVKDAGALWQRTVTDEAEQRSLRSCFDFAFGALGRIAPSSTILDLCVPRSAAGQAVAGFEKFARDAAISFGLVAHADGGLHPILLHDRGDDAQAAVAAERMRSSCVELGGTIAGSHGIGHTRRAAFAHAVGPPALDVLERVRDAFAPSQAFNPDTILPETAWP